MATSSLRRLSGLFSAASSPISNTIPRLSSTSKLRVVVKSLFKEKDPDKLAAGFLSAAASSARFRSRHRIYEVAISRLAVASRPDLVHSIIDAHKNFLIDISKEGFALRLICLYGKAKMVSHAESLYEQLPSLNCPRTVMSFNALLTAYSLSNDMERLAIAFKEIPEKDSLIIPNVCSYNILINALCVKNELEKAMNVLNLMEICEIKPDSITFVSLLNGFYNNKKINEGDEVWELMKEKNVEIDASAFNAKIKGLISVGKLEHAVNIVEHMKLNGPKPDTNTFNLLINGYITNGDLTNAKNLYLDMVNNKCDPSKRTYNLIIPSLVEAGEFDLALNYCHDVLNKSCYIDAVIIQGVVEGLTRVYKKDEAEKLVIAGRKNGYPEEKLYLPNEQ